MTARVIDTSAEPEQIEELAVVRLLQAVTVDEGRRLPQGTLGAVVFVHNEGEAIEVEFTRPFPALVTLRRADIAPTETTRASVGTAVGVHRRRR